MSLLMRPIPIRHLLANPANISDHLEGIDDLAASIRTTGVLQPLVVNDNAGTYLVTDGHRRLEASRRAERTHLPCRVSTDADNVTVLLTMIASAMHQQLSPLELARAFRRLSGAGMSRAEIAKATGYSLNLVTQRLTLLDLPPTQQQQVAERSLTLHNAGHLARAVTTGKTTSVRLGQKTSWFGPQHALAGHVRAACSTKHRQTRTVIGGIGCGPCWEQAIRGDVASTATLQRTQAAS